MVDMHAAVNTRQAPRETLSMEMSADVACASAIYGLYLCKIAWENLMIARLMVSIGQAVRLARLCSLILVR